MNSINLHWQLKACSVARLQWPRKAHKSTFPEVMSGQLNSLCGLGLRNTDVKT